jgi:chromate transporter
LCILLIRFRTVPTDSSRPALLSAQWAVVALVAIFLPGMLLAIAGQSLWGRLEHLNGARAILAGVNASVVGILGAALYNPVFVNAVHNNADAAIAATSFVLLQRWRAPPIAVLVLCVAASVVISTINA